jgi:hypothetical protein
MDHAVAALAQSPDNVVISRRVVLHQHGLARQHYFRRTLADVTLETTGAEYARGFAAFGNQHARPWSPVRRTCDTNNSRQRGTFASLQAPESRNDVLRFVHDQFPLQ